MIISAEVATTVTLIPPGNDHNSSFSNQFSYTVSDLKNFAETLIDYSDIRAISGGGTASIMLDLAGIDVSYHNIIQHRPLPIVDHMEIIAMESVLSTMLVTEQIELSMSPSASRSLPLWYLRLQLLLVWR